jgi:hypothetical protein
VQRHLPSHDLIACWVEMNPIKVDRLRDGIESVSKEDKPPFAQRPLFGFLIDGCKSFPGKS